MFLSRQFPIFVHKVMIKRVIAILFILAGICCAPGVVFPAHAQQQETVENSATVVGGDGCMTIDNYGNDKELTFSVYSITGQIVKSLSVSSGASATINLPKGFYIVKCEYWSRKVVVK